jgi:hypothetical protein
VHGVAIPDYRLNFLRKDRYTLNIKAVLQKKATEKWYRAVRIKNLTEGPEAHFVCAAVASVQAGVAGQFEF